MRKVCQRTFARLGVGLFVRVHVAAIDPVRVEGVKQNLATRVELRRCAICRTSSALEDHKTFPADSSLQGVSALSLDALLDMARLIGPTLATLF